MGERGRAGLSQWERARGGPGARSGARGAAAVKGAAGTARPGGAPPLPGSLKDKAMAGKPRPQARPAVSPGRCRCGGGGGGRPVRRGQAAAAATGGCSCVPVWERGGAAGCGIQG